jgi:hypothetical protein
MKVLKRGRPPLGRKAMTAAQRQARRRAKLRQKIAQEQQHHQEMRGIRRLYQPPTGYGRAKEQLTAQGHEFERARRDFGFEEGVFVDGAFLDSTEVIELAAMPLKERQQRLAARRLATKDDACGAVKGYMARQRVSLDELVQYFEVRGRRVATLGGPAMRGRADLGERATRRQSR